MDNKYKDGDLDYELYLYVFFKRIFKEGKPVCCFGDENLNDEKRYYNLLNFKNEVEKIAKNSGALKSKLERLKKRPFENIIDNIIVKFVQLIVEQLDIKANIFEDKRSICYKFNSTQIFN